MYNRKIPSRSIELTVFEAGDDIKSSDEVKTYGDLLADSWIRAAASSDPDSGARASPFVLLRASSDRGHPVKGKLEIKRSDCVFLPILSSAIGTFDNTERRSFNTQATRRAEAHTDMCSRSAVPAPPTIDGEPIVDNLYPFLVETEEFDLKFDKRSPLREELDVTKKPIDHEQTYKVVAVGYCVAIKFLSSGDYRINAEALGSDRIGGRSRYQSEAIYEIKVN